MWLVIGIVAIVIVGILVYASRQPDSFRVERSTTISAEPAQVFDHIISFHRWADWSPWEHKDPAMRRTISGSDSGVGAVYEWEGNRDVGQGRMEITHTKPGELITIKLDFLKPFQAHNIAEFTLSGDQETAVTWAVFGPSPFMSKVMGMFMNMDKMIGKDFDAGLAKLKSVVEDH